jgi:protein TonB
MIQIKRRHPTMTPSHFRIAPRRITRIAALLGGIAALVAGCSVAPNKPPTDAASTTVAPPQVTPSTAETVAPSASMMISRARNPQDYRIDVAKHLYNKNAKRIFAGKMPPHLYAVGVCETEIDPRGFVANVRWTRAPIHAPEVMLEIERTIREAAPYPVPSRLGRVHLTETWLWDKSGTFQLHALTEGQL